MLRTIKDGLATNKINKVVGILNGTSNYILSEMESTNKNFKEVLTNNLRVMDMTAITLCSENSLPIIVFNINQSGNLKKIVLGDKLGTLVTE